MNFQFGKLNGRSFEEATDRYILWGYLQSDKNMFKNDEVKKQNFQDFKNFCDTKISNIKLDFGKFKDLTFKEVYDKNINYCLWVLSLNLMENNNITLRSFQKFIKNKMVELTKKEGVEEIDETIETYNGDKAEACTGVAD